MDTLIEVVEYEGAQDWSKCVIIVIFCEVDACCVYQFPGVLPEKRSVLSERLMALLPPLRGVYRNLHLRETGSQALSSWNTVNTSWIIRPVILTVRVFAA